MRIANATLSATTPTYSEKSDNSPAPSHESFSSPLGIEAQDEHSTLTPVASATPSNPDGIPDGGYGWVVCFSVMMVRCSISHMCSTSEQRDDEYF